MFARWLQRRQQKAATPALAAIPIHNGKRNTQ